MFNVTTANLINMIGISIGIGVCFILIMFVTSGAKLDKVVTRYFQILFSLIIVYIVAHLTRQIMDGRGGIGTRRALYFITFIEFFVSGIMVYMLAILVLYAAKAPKKVNKVLGIEFLAILIIHTLCLSLSQINGFYYYFDSGNCYTRASTYAISNASHALMIVIMMYLLIAYRKNYRKKALIAFWIYLLLPLVAIVIQTWVNVQLIIFATVIATVNMFTVIMQNVAEKFQQQQLQSSRMETELNMAANIQANMLPNIFPPFPDRTDIDIYASMTPAKEVGGDFYDFFLIDETHLGIVMADVSGKGVPAALFMMVSKILVQNYALMGKSAGEVLREVNSRICKNNKLDMFVTVWLGILDLESGKLTASNAGHEYPIFKTPNGSFEIYKDKHGFVIGGMDTAKYSDYEVTLEKGAKIFLYTDGVMEATDKSLEQYGAERLLNTLATVENGTTMEIVEGVDKSLEEFANGAEQFDDITMLCLVYNGKND